MDTVDEIERLPTDGRDRPQIEARIEKATVIES